MSIEWVYILIIPLSRLLRFKALPRLCWFWCFFGIIVVSKQGDQIGPFFKGLGNTFSFKCSPNTCRIWGYFEKWYFLNKKMLQLIFGLPWTKLGYFGKHWATLEKIGLLFISTFAHYCFRASRFCSVRCLLFMLWKNFSQLLRFEPLVVFNQIAFKALS